MCMYGLVMPGGGAGSGAYTQLGYAGSGAGVDKWCGGGVRLWSSGAVGCGQAQLCTGGFAGAGVYSAWSGVWG